MEYGIGLPSIGMMLGGIKDGRPPPANNTACHDGQCW